MSCETYLNTFKLETPEHALISCPMISHVRTEVLRKCGLIRHPQQTTHTQPIREQFHAQPCDKPSTFLGNLANNLITAELLKARNHRKIDPDSVGRKVRGYFAGGV